MKQYLIRLAGMVMMAFILSLFMVYDLSSISFLSPMEKANDFTVGDFYQLVAEERNVHTLEHRLVVVSVDGLSRNEITEALEAVNFCNPKAVGIDLFFNYPQPDDSLLLQALKETPGLALPCILKPKNENTFQQPMEEDSVYLFNHFPMSMFGAVNLEVTSVQGTVRSFRPFFSTKNGEAVPNFVSLLAKYTDQAAYNKLCERLHTFETINYPSMDFEIIRAEEILENADLIEGKTVLMGTINDPQDMHRTSIHNSLPGVLIHAHALATILQGSYINHLSSWVCWLIALILCTLIVALNMWLVRKEVGALIIRLIQMVLLYLIAWTGCQFFIAYHLDVNFMHPLLMVSLGLVAVDVWIGLESLYMMVGNPLKKLKERFVIHNSKHEKKETDNNLNSNNHII